MFEVTFGNGFLDNPVDGNVVILDYISTQGEKGNGLTFTPTGRVADQAVTITTQVGGMVVNLEKRWRRSSSMVPVFR